MTETPPRPGDGVRTCRFCGQPLQHSFADLGMQPPSNYYRRPEQMEAMEPFYPLHARVCAQCFLVQVGTDRPPEELFSDYAYFSSYAASWVAHAERLAEQSIARFGLDPSCRVIEVASNDGYLLQHFVKRGIPVLGVEPAANVAAAAEARGIPSRVMFFGRDGARRLAAEGFQADLMIGANVLAHVPDINDFVAGFPLLLKPHGVLVFEFPHLLRLMAEVQFDTIYHEHFSYLSLLTVETVLASHGLAVFDVEELPTHGGSLRLFIGHKGQHAEGPAVTALRQKEQQAGFDRIETYAGFPERINRVKRRLLAFLIDARDQGHHVVGYGAPAKGNTLLNYCGIGPDFLDYTVDRNPVKQGCFLPGCRIPIFAPEKLRETRPDFVLILPWNLKREITRDHAYIREWGGRFVVPIPTTEILSCSSDDS